MARRALKTEERPAAKVAGVLNPYMACSEIQGSSGEEHEDLRSAIFATLGDAYRLEGNVALAAKWYRRASQLSTGSHARVYAWLVWKNQLPEFYQDALKVLEDDLRRWALKPIPTRFFHWVRAWSNADHRQIARTRKRTLAFLRQHAGEHATSQSSPAAKPAEDTWIFSNAPADQAPHDQPSAQWTR